MEPRQMRTFRTEFNIFESSTVDTTESRTYNSSVHYATQSEWVLLGCISNFNFDEICSAAALFLLAFNDSQSPPPHTHTHTTWYISEQQQQQQQQQ
jgi:hypothetical protein